MNTESVNIDELSRRYALLYKRDLEEGQPQRGPKNHFQMALLMLATGRFSRRNYAYRIEDTSEFHSSNLPEP